MRDASEHGQRTGTQNDGTSGYYGKGEQFETADWRHDGGEMGLNERRNGNGRTSFTESRAVADHFALRMRGCEP